MSLFVASKAGINTELDTGLDRIVLLTCELFIFFTLNGISSRGTLTLVSELSVGLEETVSLVLVDVCVGAALLWSCYEPYG